MTAPTLSTQLRHEPCGCSQVAVYGTLRQGGANDIRRWQGYVACLGYSWLYGSLYDLGAYPGLVLGGAIPVLAEVYVLTPALERELDLLEGVWPEANGEYTKRIVPVQLTPLGGGPIQPISALVYEAQSAAVRGRPRIASGDWLAWLASQQR